MMTNGARNVYLWFGSVEKWCVAGGGGHEAMRNVFFIVPECIEKGWLASQWRIFAEIRQDLPTDRTNYLAGRSTFAR